MSIKAIVILFILFVLWRTILRFRQGDITFRELIIWVIFWFLVSVAALVPKKTDVVAQWLGVGRGVDLLIYISIVVLFFIVFKIIVKLEKIDRDITQIVRTTALKDKDQDESR